MLGFQPSAKTLLLKAVMGHMSLADQKPFSQAQCCHLKVAAEIQIQWTPYDTSASSVWRKLMFTDVILCTWFDYASNEINYFPLVVVSFMYLGSLPSYLNSSLFESSEGLNFFSNGSARSASSESLNTLGNMKLFSMVMRTSLQACEEEESERAATFWALNSYEAIYMASPMSI